MSAFRAIVAVFGVGFLLGELWAFLAFRDVLASVGGGVSARFIAVAAVEVAVACWVFAIVVKWRGKNQPLVTSRAALIVALLSGVIANVLTVGRNALVPPMLVAGEMQLLVYLLAIAVVAGIGGFIQVAFGSRKQNDG